MITIVANYRTGSSTFSKELGGDGEEWLHNHICDYRKPGDYNVYKVMPDQFHYEKYYKDFVKDYLEKSEKIYYTLRSDVSAQIQSYVYACKTSDWHPWSVLGENTMSEEAICWSAKDCILTNLHWQSKIYKEFGGELIWLEDRNSKYTKRVDYTPPQININLDVKSMFL